MGREPQAEFLSAGIVSLIDLVNQDNVWQQIWEAAEQWNHWFDSRSSYTDDPWLLDGNPGGIGRATDRLTKIGPYYTIDFVCGPGREKGVHPTPSMCSASLSLQPPPVEAYPSGSSNIHLPRAAHRQIAQRWTTTQHSIAQQMNPQNHSQNIYHTNPRFLNDSRSQESQSAAINAGLHTHKHIYIYIHVNEHIYIYIHIWPQHETPN